MKTNNETEMKVIDLSIKLILILLLLAWCIVLLIPFLVPVLWGVILAITLYPLFEKLSKWMKGKKVIPSVIITGILLVILILPTIWLIASVAEEVKGLLVSFRDGTLVITPPDPKISDWPVIGKPIHEAWQLLATNTEAAIVTYRDQLMAIGQKLGGSMMNVTSSVMMFILSIIIAGILMVSTEKSEKSASAFANRLVGETGNELIKVVVQTIRNVAKGILGVAVIQFILMGVTFTLAGIPFAGLWALIVLLLAIVQLPTAVVGIPAIIYMYSVFDPLKATLWTVVVLLVSLSDNFLKPWLMGMGAPVPMLVIFLGAIGGFIMTGIIGLFTGAIILSLGYKLAGMWLTPADKGTEVKA
jgi:predicted PurR-regulated permease PerM